jgi:hypothetical protein
VTSAIEITLAHARGAAQQAIVDAWLRRGDLVVTRLTAGCVCCVGQVPVRVAVTRSLRAMDAMRPRALLLLVSQDAHLPRLRAQIERGELGAGIALVEQDFAQD